MTTLLPFAITLHRHYVVQYPNTMTNMRKLLPIFCAVITLTSFAPLKAGDVDIVYLSPFEVSENTEAYGRSIPDAKPAITLRKKADFITLRLNLVNDSRLSGLRLTEIRSTVRKALEQTEDNGKIILQNERGILDKNNFRVSPKEKNNDTSEFELYLALPLSSDDSADKLTDQLITFAQSLKGEGRTLIYLGQPGLSIKNAERFRAELVGAIATDVGKVRSAFGKDAQVIISGLDQRLTIKAVSVDEVDISLNYNFTVTSSAGICTSAK